MNKYIIVQCIADDWDEPIIDVYEGINENDAFNKFYKKNGYEGEEEVQRGVEEGMISIKLKKL